MMRIVSKNGYPYYNLIGGIYEDALQLLKVDKLPIDASVTLTKDELISDIQYRIDLANKHIRLFYYYRKNGMLNKCGGIFTDEYLLYTFLLCVKNYNDEYGNFSTYFYRSAKRVLIARNNNNQKAFENSINKFEDVINNDFDVENTKLLGTKDYYQFEEDDLFNTLIKKFMKLTKFNNEKYLFVLTAIWQYDLGPTEIGKLTGLHKQQISYVNKKFIEFCRQNKHMFL